MIEVYTGLFVGDEDDYSAIANEEHWAIVHACKNPFHVEIVGYKGSLPNTHPEYRVARRGSRLALNIVDAPNPALFSRELLIIPALDFIDEQRKLGKLVLIHCNRGESRSPSLALLYLAKRLKAIPSTTFFDAEQAFIALYPSYSPKTGIRGHIQQNWDLY